MVDQLIKVEHASDAIRGGEVDRYFDDHDIVNGSLADILLKDRATAIYHVDPERFAWRDELQLLPIGINYHCAHDSGYFRTVVQDVAERKGPWVLFNPPKSDNATLYLQDMCDPDGEPEFEDDVANPLKVKNFYLFRGDPLRIFRDFEEKGFNFVNDPMSEGEFKRLMKLSGEARKG